MALGQNWTDIWGGGGGRGKLHLPQGLKRLNCECQICMVYDLQSWKCISETMFLLNVLESCGFGWLTDWLRSIQEVPVCTYPEELIILRPRDACPVHPLPLPVKSHWRMLESVVWIHRLLPLSLCVTTNEEFLHQRCVSCDSYQLGDTLFANLELGGFSWILHVTFDRLLATAVARAEHPDRFCSSPNFLFSQYTR
jgi:hypothetical protein